MKIGSVLLVVSGALIFGSAAYGIYKYYQSQKDNTIINNENTDNTTQIVSEVQDDDAEVDEIILSELETIQYEATNSIKERHNKASQHLRETLSELVSDNLETDIKINKINDDLDELLK